MAIPILPYDEHITKALDLLADMGEGGINRLRWSMSVLIYRLSKLLCAPEAPSTPVHELLTQDLQACLADPQTYPDLRAHEQSLQQAIELLKGVLQYAGWYSVDRVLRRVLPDTTDTIAPDQRNSMRETNKPYSSWGRALPFRPLYCALGIFAIAFPVRSDSRRYETPPGEDAITFDGGNDKPKTRADKQRTFATLLDACDYQVGYWKAHFKSEPSYDAVSKQPWMSEPTQRPRRKGRCYWRKERGSLSPDIVVVKLRNQPPDLNNVTHAVDMKFGEDDLGRAQGEDYARLFGATRFYVLYFPGECQAGEPEERKNPAPDWVRVLIAILMLLATRGRGGGRLPGPRPAPAG